MSEISAASAPERRFALVQELYTLLAKEANPERGSDPLDFMLRHGQW